MKISFLIQAFLIISIQSTCAQPIVSDQKTLFAAGENGYKSYRIPALIKTKKGALLAFCEGRKEGKSDAGNIDILMKKSIDEGKTWSEQTVIWDDADNTCGNPCPVLDEKTGEIFFDVGIPGPVHKAGSDN